MSQIITRRKQSSASIRLPRKPAANRRVKNTASATTQTRTQKMARPVKATATTTRTRRRKAAEAIAVAPSTTTHNVTRPAERALFIGVLVVIVLLAAVYIGAKVQSRSMRFEMTELKQQELLLMKEREKLTQQVTTHKRPEQIEKRARQRGLVLPSSQQVVKLP